MLSESDFRMQRDAAKAALYPHKIVRLDEIEQVEDNVFSIRDVDVTLSDIAQIQLNRAIGTNEKQLKMVRDFSGNVGEANFRNYLSVAKNQKDAKEIVLIASPSEQVVTDVIIPKHDFIPIDTFFDFAEMLMDGNNIRPERVRYSRNGIMDVMIYMQSETPVIQAFAPNEDFITDGSYLRWTGYSIEFGNYFVRLICTNGQTQEINESRSRIYTLQGEDVNRMMKLAMSKETIANGFIRFQRLALEAMDTQVSLRELGHLYRGLIGQKVQLSIESANEIAPYNDMVNYFETRGTDITGREQLIKTNLSWWQLYNNLTQFATHTDLLAEDDIRRTAIHQMAMQGLASKHDIKNYIEY